MTLFNDHPSCFSNRFTVCTVQCIMSKDSEVSKSFVNVVTWLYRTWFVIKCILLKDCASGDHSWWVKYLGASLTWFPAHIEVDLYFLSSGMECDWIVNFHSVLYALIIPRADWKLLIYSACSVRFAMNQQCISVCEVS